MTADIKVYKCEPCGKIFGGKGTLETHLNVVHRNIKAYRCDSCSKDFCLKHHLERHVKMIHENIKDYKCDFCGKSFGHINKTCQNYS